MTNDLATIFAGFDRCEGHVLDSAGYIAGTASTLATGGTGSNGFRLIGAKEAANIGAPEPDVVPITGDDNYMGGFIFASAQARQFILTAAVQGLDTSSYMGSGSAYAIGNSEVGVLDGVPFSPVNLALIFTSQQKSAQGSNVGTGLYGGIIVPQVQGIPLGRQTFAERAAGIMRFKFVISQATAFPWGETFKQVSTQLNVLTGSYVPWIADNRVAMFAARGDGATTIFGPFTYSFPTSATLSQVNVYVNGYKRYANVTINTNKTITFSVAPASNDRIAVYYEHV